MASKVLKSNGNTFAISHRYPMHTPTDELTLMENRFFTLKIFINLYSK